MFEGLISWSEAVGRLKSATVWYLLRDRADEADMTPR
jgi:hypothetical protein